MIGALLITLNSCGSGNSGGTTTSPQQQAATPTFSPTAGTYTSAQTVSLSDTTTGASIYGNSGFVVGSRRRSGLVWQNIFHAGSRVVRGDIGHPEPLAG
jgi:hypothetical protein